jgi:hypothetical protein
LFLGNHHPEVVKTNATTHFYALVSSLFHSVKLIVHQQAVKTISALTATAALFVTPTIRALLNPARSGTTFRTASLNVRTPSAVPVV